MNIPEMIKVSQRFDNRHITGIEATVRDELLKLHLDIKKNSTIAIAVGSRGIANIGRIVRTAVLTVKELGGTPFIVPAMGSHGGATARGQEELLEQYGITEELTGAPVKSSMEVVELPRGSLENRVYMDRNAFQADGTIVINRIKVHTDFHGPTESGLMKLCVIGLGKHRQALEMHKYGVHGLRDLIPQTARQVLKHGNIIAGIGIVENAYDQTLVIKALRPAEFEDEEMKLLDISRANMPGLPAGNLDILIVDKIGKDISGTGVDTNIIGRIKIDSEKDPEFPRIRNIIFSDLTEATHGNALGLGLGDFITKKLFRKIDFKSTYENVITSTFLERGKIPIIADTDRQALEYAIRACRSVDPDRLRIIRIKDTLHLGELYVSSPVLEEIKDKDHISVNGGFKQIFNASEELIPF